jgi:hypothetical protein
MEEGCYIRLKTATRKRALHFYLGFSSDLREYLYSNSFYVKYGKNVNQLPLSILNIAGASALYTFALITGATLFVEELDRAYLMSLKRFRNVLDKFFPGLCFHGKIVVDKIVHNNFSNHGNALMFSGGVDSTHLYTKIRHLKPDLYTIIGGTIPVTQGNVIKEFTGNIRYFAEKEGVKVNFVETNIGRVLNEGLLTARYGGRFPQPDSTWWGKVSHGIVQLSICAPVTARDKIGLIHIAASHQPSPDGTHARMVDKVFWEGTKVYPDISDYTKFEKMQAICDTFSRDPSVIAIQTCNYAPVNSGQLNCGSCSKCVNPILSLMALGHDPRNHGFPIIKDLDKQIEKKLLPRSLSPEEWIRIQQGVDENNEKILDMFKDFLQKYKRIKFVKRSHVKPDYGQRVKCGAMKVTSRLPRNVRETILKRYYEFKYFKEIEPKTVRACV